MNIDLSASLQRHDFADPQTLAEALAEGVADNLRTALAQRDLASIALSGGSTPKAFLRALSTQALDWSRVVVTLVDERWVAEDNPRSNARLLRDNLLQGAAAVARFLPLYRESPQPETALGELEHDLSALASPLDVAVLGMGNDGHTASFFPGGDRLAEALDTGNAARVVPMRAPGAGEPRITLTLAVLLSARHLYLHIEGAEKRQVLQQALSGEGLGSTYPIRSVLAHASSPVLAYWSA